MSAIFPLVAPAHATFGGGIGKIAYQTGTSGNLEIWTKNPDGLGQARISNNAALDEQPSWSPDGKKIAFDTNRDGNLEIYTMNADGTNQTRITNNAASTSWRAGRRTGTRSSSTRAATTVTARSTR